MASSAPKYDIVVYGATGFTGRLVVKYLAAHCPRDVTYAMAGRDADKLRALQEETAKFAHVPYLVASTARDHAGNGGGGDDDGAGDSNDNDAARAPPIPLPASLLRMARSARVVVNCAGPFVLSGAQVVEACIAGGADYTDICGEPNFLAALGLCRPESDVFRRAAAAGVLVVLACGFDSCPADLGTLFALRCVRARYEQSRAAAAERQEASGDGDVHANVECLMHFCGPVSISSGSIESISSGTFKTVLESVARASRSDASRRAATTGTPAPSTKSPASAAATSNVSASLSFSSSSAPAVPKPARPRVHREARLENRVALPFSSSDPFIVRRTASADAPAAGGRAVLNSYAHYLVMDSVWSCAKLAYECASVFALTRLGAFGRRRLERRKPAGSGPNETQRRQTSSAIHFYADAQDGARRLRVRVESVCRTSDMYEATAVFAVQAALCLLRERDRLPHACGSFTCGAAMGEALLDRLRALPRDGGGDGVAWVRFDLVSAHADEAI